MVVSPHLTEEDAAWGLAASPDAAQPGERARPGANCATVVGQVLWCLDLQGHRTPSISGQTRCRSDIYNPRALALFAGQRGDLREVPAC
jgi:hypothetical protein